MKILMKLKQFVLLMCLLSAGVGYVSAQDYRAIVKGVVTDETGEGVIGATIMVKNESTGFSAGSITNETGEYIVKLTSFGFALLCHRQLCRLWRSEEDRIYAEPR